MLQAPASRRTAGSQRDERRADRDQHRGRQRIEPALDGRRSSRHGRRRRTARRRRRTHPWRDHDSDVLADHRRSRWSWPTAIRARRRSGAPRGHLSRGKLAPAHTFGARALVLLRAGRPRRRALAPRASPNADRRARRGQRHHVGLAARRRSPRPASAWRSARPCGSAMPASRFTFSANGDVGAGDLGGGAYRR